MEDRSIDLPDGRTVGFTESGASQGTAVLWCHGGPGSRLEPVHLGARATEAGLRLIGIDRPGYGRSTAHPGRTVGGWVPEALAVADHLGVDEFATVGVSTGGAFALALAALASPRVLGVVACCSVTDMRWPEGRATMSQRHAHDVWDAKDRASAIDAAIASHGLDGSKIFTGKGPPLATSDLALFADPEWARETMATMPAMFTHGLDGYADDRIADGPGWVTFDVEAITCPVIVLHGGSDVVVDVIHAEHTAAIVPHAELRVFAELGHFSIETEILPAVVDLLCR